MAYDSNNQIISAPVSFRDVQQCLSKSDTDLGTLCKADNINIWAKNKPMRHSSPATLTYNQKRAIYFGLVPPMLSAGVVQFNALAKTWIDNMERSPYTWNWPYEAPRGNVNSGAAIEYYRLTDFDGYAHTTGHIFTDLQNRTSFPTSSGAIEINVAEYPTITFVSYNNPYSGGITLWDLLGITAQSVLSYRLVVELYGYSSYPNWYSSSVAPVKRYFSNRLTSESDSFAVNIDLVAFEQEHGTGRFYAVLGYQCWNDEGTDVETRGTYRGMLPPFSWMYAAGTSHNPFFYDLWFVSHIVQTITVAGVRVYVSGGYTWLTESGTAYITTQNLWNSNVIVRMKIYKSTYAYRFVGGNTTVPSSYRKMMIRVFSQRTPSTVAIFTPCTDTGSNASYYDIPSGTSGYVEVYGIASILDYQFINSNGSDTYQLQVNYNDASEWNDIGSFSIFKS